MFKNYNMNQIVIPLDLEKKLQENDITFHIHHLVESIPQEAFTPFNKETGCSSYHPKMMLKIILCGYTQSVFSGRRIEDLVKESDPFKTSNWAYDEATDSYTCPNEKALRFQYHSTRKDQSGFVRQFKVYECDDCTGCPFRSSCTKAAEGTNRKMAVNLNWEAPKAYVQQKLSEPETAAIYRRRKIDGGTSFWISES